MTSRRLAPSSLPDWPALMNARLAAAYLDMSPNWFAALVNRGTLPPPAVNGDCGRMKRWSRAALDRWVADR